MQRTNASQARKCRLCTGRTLLIPTTSFKCAGFRRTRVFSVGAPGKFLRRAGGRNNWVGILLLGADGPSPEKNWALRTVSPPRGHSIQKNGRRGYLLFHEDDVPYKIQITVHRSSFGIYLPEAYSPMRPYIHVEKRTTLLGTISERTCCATEVLNTGEGGRSSFGTRKLSLVPRRLIRSDRLATVVSRWLCPPRTSQRGSRAGGAKPNPSQPFVRTSGGPPESLLLSLFPVSEALSPDPSEGVSDAHRPLSSWSVARASQQ